MSDSTNNDLIKKALLLETRERTAFLEQIEDKTIRKEIAFLLADDTASTSFILKTSAGTKPLENPLLKDFEAGDRIKQFVVVKLIAKGGMGSVYLAYDEKLKRNVAIKTIRSEYMENDATQKRFKQEAQILSQINHPSICQIYDYIDYEDGELLVLELVEGTTLNDSQLNDSYKLNVIVQLASALNAAHNKGIIHRDLKPDNIMLTKQGNVKILDFGIAKTKKFNFVEENSSLIKQDFDKPLTKMGTLMGTLLYMSPEQAAGEEVTKASDIYSLGIIVQEFLTNLSFYNIGSAEDLKQQVIDANRINHQYVPKKYQALIQLLTQKNHQLRPRANKVADLIDEIIEKPKRRLKQIFFAAIVVFSVLGFVKYTYDLNQQRNQAEIARVEAVSAKQEAEKVTEFLESLFEVSDPYENNGETITARQILDDGSKRIDTELNNQPRTLVRLKIIIGNVYRKLGLHESADNQLSEAIKFYQKSKIDDHELMMRLLHANALLKLDTSELDEAVESIDNIFQLAEKNHSTNTQFYKDVKYDLGVIQSKRGKFNEATLIFNQLLEDYKGHKKENNSKVIGLYNSLGLIKWQLGKLPDAEVLMKRALSLFSNSKSNSSLLELKLTVMNNLINIAGDQGNYEEAIEYGLETLNLKGELLPENHPDMALSYDNLAIVYCRNKQLQKCQELNLKALEIYKESTGVNNIDYAYTLANRSAILKLDGNNEGAINAIKTVIEIFIKIHGKDHYDVAHYFTTLGNIYFDMNQMKKAVLNYKKSQLIYTNINFSLTHDVKQNWTKLAQTYENMNQGQLSKETYQDFLVRLESEEEQDLKTIEEVKQKIKLFQ